MLGWKKFSSDPKALPSEMDDVMASVNPDTEIRFDTKQALISDPMDLIKSQFRQIQLKSRLEENLSQQMTADVQSVTF